MTISVLLGLAIFFLGAAVGALLTQLQAQALKRRSLHMMGHLEALRAQTKVDEYKGLDPNSKIHNPHQETCDEGPRRSPTKGVFSEQKAS
jgi:hypothetical protein